MTSVPRVFAAEELADARDRQTATMVGDGYRVVIDAERRIES